MIEKREFYSKKLNLIFYNITKCAMTSIVREKYFEWKITPVQEIPEDAKIFAIIRDPFERFVSSYVHLKKHNLIKSDPRSYLEKIKNEGFFNSHCWPQVAFLDTQNFKNLLMENCYPGKGEIHNEPWDFNGRLIKKIDLYLRFENLNQDVKTYISDDINLSYLNNNQSKKTSFYKDFLKYRCMISDMYKVDYDFLQKIRQRQQVPIDKKEKYKLFKE